MTVICILYDNQNSVTKKLRYFCLLFETKLSLSFVKYLHIGNMVVLFGLGFGERGLLSMLNTSPPTIDELWIHP